MLGGGESQLRVHEYSDGLISVKQRDENLITIIW